MPPPTLPNRIADRLIARIVTLDLIRLASIPVSLSLLLSPAAFGAGFFGTIATTDGARVSGAMVSVSNADSTQRQTVYTDESGRYSIKTPFEGELTLRIRTPSFNDNTRTLTASRTQESEINVLLGDQKNEAAISDTLTASAHVAMLEWQSPGTKATFISQCNYCHQVGNSLTRTSRERAEWVMTVRRMAGYGSFVPYDEAVEIIDSLHEGFDGSLVKSIQSNDLQPGLANVKVEEWWVGNPMSFIHDADFGEDGNLYGADQGDDIIYELDMKTNQVTAYQMPDPGLPVGGMFSAFPLPLGVFTGKQGPHSLAEDEHGKFWITSSLSGRLTSFDTHTKEFKDYEIGNGAVYPHTIRIDKVGMIWFTIAASNQLGRFDPKTETFTVIDLPVDSFVESIVYDMLPSLLKLATWLPVDLKTYGAEHREPGKSLPTTPYTWVSDRTIAMLPYGIDIHPGDGSVWYSKLYGDKIARVDPRTLEIEEWDTPLSGPRRLRFDSKGILWIPSFDESALMRFDPSSRSFEHYPMPKLAENEWEIPYALNVHPKTDDIWITSNNSDRIFRFDQETESFASYPSPTRVTYLRDLVFGEDGKVCSAQANIPAYAIEGGRPSFICFDPEGGLRDRQAQ